MFGFGIKKRTREAISRGVQASLTGAYFHPSQIEKYNLNKDASAWILTETYAHHLYAIGCIATHACQNDKWATFDFFVNSALEGIRKSEKKGGPNTDELAPIMFKRYSEMEAHSSEARLNDEHYRESALLVSKQDKSANIDVLTRAFKGSTEKYMEDVRKMFGV